MSTPAPIINLVFDPTPMPVESLAERWGRDPKTLKAWARKGWIPGAFKHPSGEWFYSPLALLNWSPPPEDPEDAQTEGTGNSSQKGRRVSREEEAEWERDLRPRKNKLARG
jgi:hypothetical protein